MKKISDYKGEEALDVLADIIEPLTAIFADEDVRNLTKSSEKVPPIKYVKPIIKNHKREIIEILARIEGVPYETYEASVTIVSLPIQIMSFISDPHIRDLFTLQGQETDEQSFGPASEGIKE